LVKFARVDFPRRLRTEIERHAVRGVEIHVPAHVLDVCLGFALLPQWASVET
jgi:hypothetical protein